MKSYGWKLENSKLAFSFIIWYLVYLLRFNGIRDNIKNKIVKWSKDNNNPASLAIIKDARSAGARIE